MPLQRSLFPYARVAVRGGIAGAAAHRLLHLAPASPSPLRGTRGRGRGGRGPGAGLAVTSTLGLSFAAAYWGLVAVGEPLHADRRAVPPPPPEQQGEQGEWEGAGAADADERAWEIRTLRERKSVESFAVGARTATDAERALRRYEETHRPPAASGVARFDVAQVASNDPSEDDHAEACVPAGGSHWSFFAVLDGHSGWETSAVLREELIACVAKELQEAAVAGAGRDSGLDADAGDPFADAIRRAFVRLDDEIVHGRVERVLETAASRSAATALLAPAHAGACALLAFHDAASGVLRVALTGDCRAVLGRRRRDGRYALAVLTRDQTGHDPAERRRVEAAHPGEVVVQDGRTMGFGPARVFGDGPFKWSRGYLGQRVRAAVKTPPYFTAEPVVTATDVNPGDFVVLATDGLWECLTNEEVVGLVGEWVHRQEGRGSTASWWNSWWRRADGASAEQRPDNLPVVRSGAAGKDTTTGADDSVRYRQWQSEKSFVTVGANPATHLLRNALGGADEDLREALLSMRSPRARIYRDDITVTVVFFGERG